MNLRTLSRGSNVVRLKYIHPSRHRAPWNLRTEGCGTLIYTKHNSKTWTNVYKNSSKNLIRPWHMELLLAWGFHREAASTPFRVAALCRASIARSRLRSRAVAGVFLHTQPRKSSTFSTVFYLTARVTVSQILRKPGLTQIPLETQPHKINTQPSLFTRLDICPKDSLDSFIIDFQPQLSYTFCTSHPSYATRIILYRWTLPLSFIAPENAIHYIRLANVWDSGAALWTVILTTTQCARNCPGYWTHTISAQLRT